MSENPPLRPSPKLPYIVGLTGGIGSGKSTVSKFFSELGVQVIDADTVSRELVEKDSPALTTIAEHFGPQVITVQKTLNRAALREIIFSDSTQRAWLENLLHPLIRQEIKRQLIESASLINKTNSYIILSAPLLLENAAYDFINRVLVTDVPESLQLERSSHRDQVSHQAIQAVIDSQISRQDRLNAADDIIYNDQDLQYLKQQVQHYHEHYQELSQHSAN